MSTVVNNPTKVITGKKCVMSYLNVNEPKTLWQTILKERLMTIRDQVFSFVKKKYKATPEYLWRRYPDYAIFRHADNQKWFGLIMDRALCQIRSSSASGSGGSHFVASSMKILCVVMFQPNRLTSFPANRLMVEFRLPSLITRLP